MSIDEEWEETRERVQKVLDASPKPRVAVPVLIPTTKDAS